MQHNSNMLYVYMHVRMYKPVCVPMFTVLVLMHILYVYSKRISYIAE